MKRCFFLRSSWRFIWHLSQVCIADARRSQRRPPQNRAQNPQQTGAAGKFSPILAFYQLGKVVKERVKFGVFVVDEKLRSAGREISRSGPLVPECT
jgi:hypothetical protein